MKKVLIVFVLLLLCSPALPQSAVPFATYMTARPSGSLPLSGTEPTLIFQGGLVKQVSTQSYIIQGANNAPGINSIGSGGPTPYSVLTLEGADVDPSLTHNGTSAFSINGTSHASALACSTYLTAPASLWCQARNWISDGVALGFYLNPFGGGVAVNATNQSLVNNNNGVQVGNNNFNTSFYAPVNSLGISNIQTFGTPSAPWGVMAVGSTKFTATQGLNSLCFAEATSATGCWSTYTEMHRIAQADYGYNGEWAVVNRNSATNPITPYGITSVGTGYSIGLQLDAGNNRTQYTEFDPDAAIVVVRSAAATQTNLNGFSTGLVFSKDSLDPTPFSRAQAIALSATPTPQAISWWTSTTNIAWQIYSDAVSGNQTMELHNTGVDNSAHIKSGGGAPTAGSCTGFALAPGSTDSNGAVAFNSANGCSIKFNTAFTNPPFCIITPASTPSAAVVATTNASTLTATFGGNLTGMIWHCAGH